MQQLHHRVVPVATPCMHEPGHVVFYCVLVFVSLYMYVEERGYSGGSTCPFQKKGQKARACCCAGMCNGFEPETHFTSLSNLVYGMP